MSFPAANGSVLADSRKMGTETGADRRSSVFGGTILQNQPSPEFERRFRELPFGSFQMSTEPTVSVGAEALIGSRHFGLRIRKE